MEAGLVERRAGRRLDGRAHLLGHDVRERRLPEPRRTRQNHVVQRLAALERGRDEHAEVVLDLLLADELVERLGAEGLLDVLVARRVEGAAGGLVHVRAGGFEQGSVRV